MIFVSKIPNYVLQSGVYRGEVVYVSDDRIDFVIHNVGFGDTVSTTLSFHYEKLRSLISAATQLPAYAVEWMKDESIVRIAKRYYGIPFELEFYVHDKGSQVDLHRFKAIE